MPAPITLSVGADTRQMLRDIQLAVAKLPAVNVPTNIRGTTSAVADFTKTMASAEKRIISFGATAGTIYALQRVFKGLVSSMVDVEKSLTDINVILNASSQNLQKFGVDLFKIAKDTGQSFKVVADAAVEFSRQGLGVEETLKRTRDALILTRLSELDVAESTKALTATINSFKKELLDSTIVINKLATVDAKFAVSSGDLAQAIQRVGSTAEDVGVNLDSLIGLVTSAQQITSRGGSVIGNALKTIFQRIGRTDSLDTLEKFGVEVRNAAGEALDADVILQNLAGTYKNLTSIQKNQVVQQVAGVYQANIARALLSDLSRQNSIYASALNTSNKATNEAVMRNEELNKTLSALANKTLNTLIQTGSKIGELTLGPTFKGVLSEFNNLADSVIDSEGQGKKIAEGLLKGIGQYISGPGLVLIGIGFGKLFLSLLKILKDISSSLLTLNKETQTQGTIVDTVTTKSQKLLAVEQAILRTIQAQNVARGISPGPIQNVKNVPIVPPPNNRYGQLTRFGAKNVSEGTLKSAVDIVSKGLAPRQPTLLSSAQIASSGNTAKELARGNNVIPLGQFYDPINRTFNPNRSVGARSTPSVSRLPLTNVQYLDFDPLSRGGMGPFQAHTPGFSQQQFIQREQEKRSKILAIQEYEASKPRLRDQLKKGGIPLGIGVSMGASVLGDAAFSGSDLNSRRGKSVTTGIGDTASFALTGGFVGGGPGAIIGGTIGLIKALIDTTREWNNVLPDLQQNLEKAREASSRIGDVMGTILKITDDLSSGNITKPEDIKKLISERGKAVNSEYLTGDTRKKLKQELLRTDISEGDRLENLSDILSGDLNKSMARERGIQTATFIESKRQSGKLFNKNQDISSSMVGGEPTLEFGPIKYSINKEVEEFVQFLSETFISAGVKETLGKENELEQQVRQMLKVGNVGDIISVIQGIALKNKQGGLGTGIEGLRKFKPEQLNIMFDQMFNKGAFSPESLRDTEKFSKDFEDAQNSIKLRFKDFVTELDALIRETEKTTLEMEFGFRRKIRESMFSGEMAQITEGGRLERLNGFTTPLDMSFLQQNMETGGIKNEFKTKQLELAGQFRTPFRAFGLSELKDIRDNANKEFSPENVKFMQNLDSVQSNLLNMSKGFEQGITPSTNEVKEITKQFEEMLSHRLTDKNPELRNELSQINSTFRRFALETESLNEEQINELEKHTAKFEEIRKAILQDRGVELRKRFGAGKISGAQYSEFLGQEMSENISAGKGTSLRELTELFSSRFAYNKRDFFEDLKTGAIELGDTMKDSFKDAFKSFVDGTNNAKEALRSLGLAIFNKLLDKTIDIGFNSLFGGIQSGIGSMFGGAKGYASGGLVSGGSGTKDDVPMMLGAGDYVLRRSAVQKYGVNASFLNQFTYDNPTRPTSGSNNISPNLSNFALSNEESVQNNIRMGREEALIQYLKEKGEYDEGVKQALNAYKNGQRQRIYGALISAGVGVAGAGLSHYFSGDKTMGINSGVNIRGGSPGIDDNGLSSRYTNMAATGGLMTPFGVRKYANGGSVDNIPAMLTAGEYVVKAPMVNRIGVRNLDAINRGVHGYNSGGVVGGSASINGMGGDNTTLLNRLLQTFDSIKESLAPTQTKLTANSPVLNITNNFTINRDGTVTNDSKTESNGESDKDMNFMKKLSEQFKNIAVQTLIEQSRNGGLLEREYAKKR